MKKIISLLLVILLMSLCLTGATAETDCSPSGILGELTEQFSYILDSGSSIEITVTKDDSIDATEEVTFRAAFHFPGHECEVTISGYWHRASRVTLTARPGYLGMDEYAMFPEETTVYHYLHTIIYSGIPVFCAIPDGYDIGNFIFNPTIEYFDQKYIAEEGWKWVTRKPMQIMLTNESQEEDCTFSVQVLENGMAQVQWTF